MGPFKVLAGNFSQWRGTKMGAIKVKMVRRKLLGDLEVQLPVKNRSATVAWTVIFILLLTLTALSSLVYCLSVMLIANEAQVSPGVDTHVYVRAPTCGYMLMVPKNASRYVQYPYPSTPNAKGNRCAFPIFSQTKKVRISFANYSFQPSSNAGVIVAELTDERANELKYSKLDYSKALIVKTPAVIHYTSEGDEKQSRFDIEVSPIQSSGSSTGIPESASVLPYEKTGAIKIHYPWAAAHPMDYLAVFEPPSTSQPGRHFTCTPRKSTCCNAISLYQQPTFKLEGTLSKLTGLSTGGVKVSSEVIVVLMFCLPNNFDASASGSTCLLEWLAQNETRVEVDIDY